MAVINNGLAERGNKIKLNQSVADSILEKWGSNDDVVFSVEAVGVGLSYQWQVKQDGGFVNIDSPYAKLPKFRMPVIKPEDNGKVFRCKIYNSVGAVYSAEVTLNVKKATSAPTIVTQPTSTEVSTRNKNNELKQKTAKVFITP